MINNNKIKILMNQIIIIVMKLKELHNIFKKYLEIKVKKLNEICK